MEDGSRQEIDKRYENIESRYQETTREIRKVYTDYSKISEKVERILATKINDHRIREDLRILIASWSTLDYILSIFHHEVKNTNNKLDEITYRVQSIQMENEQ